jgi:AcrR family transcriptional regulator
VTGDGTGAGSGPRPPTWGTPSVAGIPLDQLAQVGAGAAGPRSRLPEIIDTAVASFGEVGYDATKWSSVADEVGIGQTALYHYFESKAHCLLTIMRLELARSLQRFIAATRGQQDPVAALSAALSSAFDVTEQEIRQLRIVTFNLGVLANPRASEREEGERQVCLAVSEEIEQSWSELLDRVAPRREPPGGDSRVMARAVLGLVDSVWRWYRPAGARSLREIADFHAAAALRVALG